MTTTIINLPISIPRSECKIYGIHTERERDTYIRITKYGEHKEGTCISFVYLGPTKRNGNEGYRASVGAFKYFDNGFKSADDFIDSAEEVLEVFNSNCKHHGVYSVIEWGRGKQRINKKI